MTDPDKLDRLLRADAARDRLDDDGFTARVMAALPPAPAPGARAWLTPALVAGSALLGSVLAHLLAPAGTGLLQGYRDLLALQMATPAAIASLAVAGALLLTAVILAAED